MKKKVTAGIIFHDGKKFLAVKPTGQNRWDVPKGCVEKDEKHLEAALREVKEETDIDSYYINKNFILDMGIRSYNNEKDIHLFVYYGNIDFIKLEECKCNSYFKNENGETLPEVEKYIFVQHEQYKKYFSGNMLRVVNDIFEETNLCSKRQVFEKKNYD